MNLDGGGSSVMASHHRSKDSRLKSAGLPLKSQAVGLDEDSYDDEEFESVGSPRLSSTHQTPRLSWMETEHDMIDMSTQTVVHSGMVENVLFECITQAMKLDFVFDVQISVCCRYNITKEVSFKCQFACFPC